MCSRDTRLPQHDRRKTKPPWSHCVTWLLQETPPLKYRKPRHYSTSPDLNLSQNYPVMKGHLLSRYPVAWQPEGRQLDCTLCKSHHQRLCKHRHTPLAGGLISPNFCHPLHLSNSQAEQKGKLLGHNLPKPFLMPKREWDEKCLFSSTHHISRLAWPLESTSCPNKIKHHGTSGLGKQFEVSWDITVSENIKVIWKRIKRHLTLRSNGRQDKNSFISDNKCFWDTWCV